MVDVREEEEPGNAIKTIFDLLTSDLHTCCPGVIVDFNGVTRTCSVQPALLRQFTGDQEATLLPVQQDVPVAYPGSGDYFLEYPLNEGDEVVCVISERAIDQWLDFGGTVDPGSQRRFALSDIIVIAGLKTTINIQAPVGEGIAMRNRLGTTEMRVVDEEITTKITGVTMKFAANLGAVPPTPGELKIEGNVPGVPTDVVVWTTIGPPPGYVSLANHIHPVAGANTGPPTGVP